MLFDVLAGIVERNLPELKKLLNECTIFDFTGHEFSFIAPDLETMYELCERFILPFNTVAFDTNKSCCIISTSDSKAVGIKQKIDFLVFIKAIFQRMGNIEVWTLCKGSIKDVAIRPYLGPEGEEYGFETEDKSRYEYIYTIDVGNIYGLNEKERKIVPLNFVEKVESYHENIAMHVIMTLEQFLKFNTPNRFVVEVTPTKRREWKSKRITRTPDRQTYTLLTISEIQKRYGLGREDKAGTGKSPAPHPRRRHYRTLKDERFTYKKGQTILIPATWVGRSEATIGNKIYRVRVDV
jgi:hypothetical protein